MYTPSEQWDFDTLDIYNYKKPGQYDLWFNFIRMSCTIDESDYAEVGVFKGRTLLATALLLRELGSKKTIFAYDSFEGFPVKSAIQFEDQIRIPSSLKDLTFQDQQLFERRRKLILIANSLSSEKVNPLNISNSKDFSTGKLSDLLKKIDFLGLTNIKIIKGFYSETLKSTCREMPTCGGLFLDCDLYESYMASLKYFWQILTPGAMVYLDEYYSLKFPGARIAVDEFLADKNFGIISFSGRVDDEFDRIAVVKQ
jgi:hypothetical protein